MEDTKKTIADIIAKAHASLDAIAARDAAKAGEITPVHLQAIRMLLS